MKTTGELATESGLNCLEHGLYYSDPQHFRHDDYNVGMGMREGVPEASEPTFHRNVEKP